MCSDQFNAKIIPNRADGPVRVHVAGDIDAGTAPALAQVLARAMAANLCLVEIDLSAGTFFSCAAVGVLCPARRQGTAAGTAVTLVGVGPPVRRLLSVLGLAPFFGLDREARVP
jgi:anti-anti-sigma factor